MEQFGDAGVTYYFRGLLPIGGVSKALEKTAVVAGRLVTLKVRAPVGRIATDWLTIIVRWAQYSRTRGL